METGRAREMEKSARAGISGVWAFLLANRRFWLLAAGALLGLLLLFWGGSIKAEGEKAPEAGGSAAELLSYQRELEARIEVLCEAVAGVSGVDVLVQLECGPRTHYATDRDGKPLTVGSGSTEEAVAETVLPPVVAGVGIVCHGGATPTVQRTLTDLVSTALNIASHKVSVVGK